jgi:hypothetical protein
MFFVRIDEQPRLQLLRRRSAGTGASRLIHKREQSAGRKRKGAHLPIAALIAGRKQCRPEATVNERHFPADEFCGPDFAAGMELLEAPEDLVRSRMRPPRSRDRLARDQADRAGQQFVLQEEQAVPLERRG